MVQFAIRIFKILILAVFGCVSAGQTTPQELAHRKFNSFQNTTPHKIWISELGQQVRKALDDYRLRKKLSNGLEYGASVRNFSLQHRTAEEIDREMAKQHCAKRNELIRSSQSQLPVKNARGSTIPMYTYLCPDGGVLRVKPEGDSTSRFRPQPHAIKALRYPFDANYRTFEDEMLKIDNEGNPIPKWAKDLNQVYSVPELQKEFIEGWAEDAHTDLRMN